jgi:hypothetical protein
MIIAAPLPVRDGVSVRTVCTTSSPNSSKQCEHFCFPLTLSTGGGDVADDLSVDLCPFISVLLVVAVLSFVNVFSR